MGKAKTTFYNVLLAMFAATGYGIHELFRLIWLTTVIRSFLFGYDSG